MSSGKGKQAIVIGGSIAGLLAARVASEHFDRVLVLERDPTNGAVQSRKGVPQGRHTHGLLAGGLLALERLFPGIGGDLARLGAVTGDLLADSRWYVEGGYHAQAPSGLIASGQSRPLLEHVVRRRLTAIPNVELASEYNVERLVASRSGQRIVAAQVAERRQNCGRILEADLIIDASGRGSRTPAWLADLGFAPPREERVEVNLAYATRTYRRRPGDLYGWNALVVTASPENMRSGVAMALEDNRWSVTLGGMAHHRPPRTDEAFLHFARQLPTPELYDILRHAEPLTSVEYFPFPASIRRRYERLARFPEGLVVLGDAMCSFNPVYGQGMTVAALEAELLGRCLRERKPNMAKRYFQQAGQLVDTPWQIAVTADFQFPHTRGDRPWSARLMNDYLRRVHRAAHRDSEVAMAFHRVANLVDAPRALLQPWLMSRVLRGKPAPFAPAPVSAAAQLDSREWSRSLACTD